MTQTSEKTEQLIPLPGESFSLSKFELPNASEQRIWNGVGFQLLQYMRKHYNNVFQHTLENNVDETYGIILEKSIKVAITLKSKNLGDDPIVAICADRHSNSCISLISCFFLGYRIVTFDGSLSETDLSYLLSQVTPDFMFIDENFIPLMEAAMKLIGKDFPLINFGTNDGKHELFDSFMNVNDEEGESFQPIKLDSDKKTAMILFSSGTTGLQKGICLSHAGLLENSRAVGILQGYSQHSRILSFTTFNWITAPIILIACAMFGAARVVAPITKTIKAIHKYKVTHMYASPYKASLSLNQSNEDMCVDSLKSLQTLGSKAGEILYRKLKERFPKTLITQAYGQTEATGWITTFPITSNEDRLLAQRKPDSIGKLLPGMQFKIVDPESEKLLGTNEVGELRIKGNLMNGYFNKDSSNVFDSEGYLKTGDLMYYDEDKCFFIQGRCKDLLKYRGFHIQPFLLEQILESRPEVDKAVVVGVPHELDGDHPMALVLLKTDFKGHIRIAKELELFVEERVQERQRLRAGVKLVNYLPFTSTGKPQRHLIKQLLENNQI